MDIGKAFKESYGVCKEHPAIFLPYILKDILNFLILISLVFSIVLTLGIDISTLSSFDLEKSELSLFLLHLKSLLTPGAIFFIFFGITVAATLWIIINSAADGATIYFARQVIKNGANLSVFEGARKYALPISGYDLFISSLYLIAVVVFLIFTIFFYFLPESIAVFFFFLMFFLLILVLITLKVASIFSRQFIAGEDKGIILSFRESFRFVSSNLFSVFLYIAGAGFIVMVFAIITTMLSILSDVLFISMPFLQAFASFMIFIFSFLAGAAISAYLQTVKTIFVLERYDKD